MKYLTAFILCVVGITKSKSEKISFTTVDDFLQDLDNRIISGGYALPGQLPWQVAINVTNILGETTLCGGSLIDERWVLTAATCTEFAQEYSISMGSIYRGQMSEEGLVVMKTNISIVHQNYSKITRNNNIALLKLNESVTFTDKIKKIELANATDYLSAGVPVLVSGWGLKRKNCTTNYSSTLKYANLTTISNNVCKYYYYLGLVTNETLCALGDTFQSPCRGDEGSPLITTDTNRQAVQVGIVSFISAAGCTSGDPSGYIRTASYRTWISEQTSESENGDGGDGSGGNGGGGGDESNGDGGSNGNRSNTLYNVNALFIIFITAILHAFLF